MSWKEFTDWLNPIAMGIQDAQCPTFKSLEGILTRMND